MQVIRGVGSPGSLSGISVWGVSGRPRSCGRAAQGGQAGGLRGGGGGTLAWSLGSAGLGAVRAGKGSVWRHAARFWVGRNQGAGCWCLGRLWGGGGEGRALLQRQPGPWKLLTLALRCRSWLPIAALTTWAPPGTPRAPGSPAAGQQVAAASRPPEPRKSLGAGAARSEGCCACGCGVWAEGEEAVWVGGVEAVGVEAEHPVKSPLLPQMRNSELLDGPKGQIAARGQRRTPGSCPPLGSWGGCWGSGGSRWPSAAVLQWALCLCPEILFPVLLQL